MTKKALILHHEYYNSFLNKNIGYFIKTCLDNGIKVNFLTQKAHDDYNNCWGERFKVTVEKLELKNIKGFDYVWLYPFHKHLILLIFLLKLFGSKVILKMDGVRLGWKKGLFVSFLANYILVESKTVANSFINKKRLVSFSSGLNIENIEKINWLSKKIKRQKTILYSGRIVKSKGLDRIIKIFIKLIKGNVIDAKWKLKVVGKIVEKNYFEKIKKMLKKSGFSHRVIFLPEMLEDKYYAEILKASLIVLPTRGEGFPNVFADSFFSKRLFLTTQGAKCKNAILDKTFYCKNTNFALEKSFIKIINNLDNYYQKFESIYNSEDFAVTNNIFKNLL